MGGLHVIQVLKYGVDAHDQVQDPQAPATAQLTQIMKPVTGAVSGLTVAGLAAMFGLAIGYKRDKLAYNPETEDTVSVDHRRRGASTATRRTMRRSWSTSPRTFRSARRGATDEQRRR